MSNFAPEDFRPYVSGEEGIDYPIRVGGYVTTPYWNGLWTAAANFNHLLAFSHKPVIQQYGSADLVYTSPTRVVFARYVIRVPSLLDRRVLRVEVTGTTSGGTTFTPEGRLWTSVTTPGWTAGTATASGSTCTFDIIMLKNDNFQILDLGFTMSASATFTVTSVVSYLAPEPVSGGGADLGTSYDANAYIAFFPYSGQPLYTPQATLTTPQYDVNLPLTVAMMSDLTIGLQGMFRDNVSPLVNWSYWHDHATITTADVGIPAAYTGRSEPVAQYIYWPRQGVRKLKVFAVARQDNYTTPGKLSIDWKGLSSYDAVNISTATSVFTLGGWVVWGGDIEVPQTGGPCYLEIRVNASSDGPAYVQSFAAFENSEEGL